MIYIKNASICLEDDSFKDVDLTIENGIISYIGKLPQSTTEDCVTIDAQGMLLVPSFIDPHVHLREPGFEYKEDFITGTNAAIKGGFGKVCCMPNTKPSPDTPESLSSIMELAKTKGKIPCYFFSPLTYGLKGEKLVDFEELVKTGAIGFSDDGKGLQNAGLMALAMKRISNIDSIITAHCEDESLLFDGYIHDGIYARNNNHKGISSASESVQVARDVLLALDHDTRYHVCHISTKESLAMVEYGKTRKGKISCEVTPHHLLLCDEDIEEDGLYKMNPPLRSREDMIELRIALSSGLIDCIATDHAPHARTEKNKGLRDSAFGIIGLETAFSLLYTKLCKEGKLPLWTLINAMTKAPADIFRIPCGEIRLGGIADLILIDLSKQWEISEDELESKSNNTPFLGERVFGYIDTVILDDKIKLRGGKIVE
ncbi:MAG: dihydroorotase [Tissierellia bacterium]|nr:dihydroorotase [Tissierellia bacterium]